MHGHAVQTARMLVTLMCLLCGQESQDGQTQHLVCDAGRDSSTDIVKQMPGVFSWMCSLCSLGSQTAPRPVSMYCW